MQYVDLLDAHMKYGTTKEDIIKRKGYDKILENVVIAPWWSHDIFEQGKFQVEQINDKIFNFYSDEVNFSYIELKRIGAPAIMDFILSLGVTKCQNLVFLGSAGSLDESIKIGDIVIPEYSICGDGASRYLNDNLEDEFLKKEYPSKEITECLRSILKDKKIKYHYVPNYSIDTVFVQFYHLDKIIELGAKTIEMETALFFKCNELLKINVTALLCISDNTIMKKSLYSGRTDKENDYRHMVRYNIIPNVIIELFKRNNMITTKLLDKYLKQIYSKETCYPSCQDNWHVNNPSLGHCAIVALIVNDYFKGDIYKIKVEGISHYFNIIDNKIIDLTSNQFPNKINYSNRIIKSRDDILSDDNTRYRYNLLKSKLEELLNRKKV